MATTNRTRSAWLPVFAFGFGKIVFDSKASCELAICPQSGCNDCLFHSCNSLATSNKCKPLRIFVCKENLAATSNWLMNETVKHLSKDCKKMNRNLCSTLGIITLLFVATGSINTVNAQSSFAPSSGWYSSPSQPYSGGIGTVVSGQYYSPVNASNSYAPQYAPQYTPQAYNWNPSQPPVQNWSWSAQHASSTELGIAQPMTLPRKTYGQQQWSPVISPTYAPNAASVVGCQPGGT